MIKLFKEAFKITNDNIILATPLILFLWIISLYMAFSRTTVDTLPELILSTITLLFMTAAFFGGWFYMLKKAVILSKEVYVLDDERAKATLNLIKEIPAGIGGYFLPFIGMSIFFLIIISIAGGIIYYIGMHFIGSIDMNGVQLQQAMANAQGIKTVLDTMPMEQLIKLNNWNLLFLAFSSILSFLMLLWLPEIMFKTKNPFKAFFISIAKIFKKPLNSIKLFFYLTLVNFMLSFISTFALFNSFIYMIMMIVYFYFMVYAFVLIFLYYDNEFVEA